MDLSRAWDLWREASCAEIGDHWWRFSLDPGGGDWVLFTCGRCPVTVEARPVDDEIITPWGDVFPVVYRVCPHCDRLFRRPVTGTEDPVYCCQAHKSAARDKRKRKRKAARAATASQRAARRAELAAAYLLAAPRLAAETAAREAREAAFKAALIAQCPTPGKLSWDNPGDAAAKAARDAKTFGRPYRPYYCDPDNAGGGCGRWHVTARYATARFIPRPAFAPAAAGAR